MIAVISKVTLMRVSWAIWHRYRNDAPGGMLPSGM